MDGELHGWGVGCVDEVAWMEGGMDGVGGMEGEMAWVRCCQWLWTFISNDGCLVVDWGTGD